MSSTRWAARPSLRPISKSRTDELHTASLGKTPFMDTTDKLAVAFGASRIAYALALLAAPGRAAGPWLGDAAANGGGRVAARALAIRDGAMGAGVIAAAVSGSGMKPLLLACAVSDAVDMTATVLDRDSLPPRSAPATVAVAGGMAAAGLALRAACD